MLSVSLLLFFLGAIHCVAVPERGQRPLSKEPHYTPENGHNQQFDTEAFLGKEEAAEYKNLSPEESLRRLRLLLLDSYTLLLILGIINPSVYVTRRLGVFFFFKFFVG